MFRTRFTTVSTETNQFVLLRVPKGLPPEAARVRFGSSNYPGNGQTWKSYATDTHHDYYALAATVSDAFVTVSITAVNYVLQLAEITSDSIEDLLLPAITSSDKGKIAQVNAAGTAWGLADAPSGGGGPRLLLKFSNNAGISWPRTTPATHGVIFSINTHTFSDDSIVLMGFNIDDWEAFEPHNGAYIYRVTGHHLTRKQVYTIGDKTFPTWFRTRSNSRTSESNPALTELNNVTNAIGARVIGLGFNINLPTSDSNFPTFPAISTNDFQFYLYLLEGTATKTNVNSVNVFSDNVRSYFQNLPATPE